MVIQNPQYLIKYFEIEIKNDQLYFDYKLKDGVCKKNERGFLDKASGNHLNTACISLKFSAVYLV